MASRQRTICSQRLARPLEARRVRKLTEKYLDRYGWDVCDDEAAWRRHQRKRMAKEYRGDSW